MDPIEVKDDGAVERKDDEEKAFHCTECDFRSECRRRFLSHYELAHVLPDNFSCEFWCAFCTWLSQGMHKFFSVGELKQYIQSGWGKLLFKSNLDTSYSYWPFVTVTLLILRM